MNAAYTDKKHVRVRCNTQQTILVRDLADVLGKLPNGAVVEMIKFGDTAANDIFIVLRTDDAELI